MKSPTVNAAEEQATITVTPIPPLRAWWFEVWASFRPYLIKLSSDFLAFVCIWLLLLGAHSLTSTLPLGTTLSKFLVGFHETTVVLTFVWLSLAAILDLINLKKKV